MRKRHVGSVLLTIGIILFGARYVLGERSVTTAKVGDEPSREPEDHPSRRPYFASALLATGLVLLGAWYMLGGAETSADNRDQSARIVPTRPVGQQRPAAVPASLPPIKAVRPGQTSATATQGEPTARPSAGDEVDTAASVSRRSHMARAEGPTATPLPTRAPPTNTSVPANTRTPEAAAGLGTAANPVRFVVDTPEVRVDAPVEHVGLTAERAMEAPEGWWNVGWYELGPRPGEQGNAVLAGHLDSESGPAVFWQLSKMRIGDEVAVIDAQGSTIRFRVREMQVYYNDDAPLTKIFGKADGAHLNLITCDGYFDRNAGIYDRRLVVYTDKIG